ncbi:MAG: ion transporter [Hyphomicrobiales bacterium]|nr:ion transporter [Hyphomicrobiales bacterium]
MVAELDGAGLKDEQSRDKRAQLRRFFESAFWERTIVVLIVVNALAMGLETSQSAVAATGGLLRIIDNVVITIFTIEIALRILAYGSKFWRDGWSLFDFTIVAVALMPATGGFAVLRSLRIIRALRLISTVKSMRRVMGGMLAAIPSMGAVIALLALIFYVAAVMATKLYGQDYPENFGTLGDSFFSLFQVMTLEGWADNFVIPVMEKHPYSWIFFIVFMLVTSFTVLNLFIGIIVDAMQREQLVEDAADRVRDEAREEANFETIMAELHALRTEIHALKGAGSAPSGQGHPQPGLDP